MALFVVLPAAPADALPEALDPTFGSAGVVTTPIGGTGVTDTALGMARDATGRYVVAGGSGSGTSFGSGGDFALVRYNADGGLDTTFGGDGKVTTSFVADQSKADEARAVAIQSNGKIVAAGIADTPTADVGDFAVARYNADGSPDTDFGGGDGQVTVNFGHDDLNALALQGDKIVLAGSTSSDFALARLNSDGTPDTGFDTDGKVTTPIGPGSNSDAVRALAIDPDGKIVAAGFAQVQPSGFVDQDFALARYNDAGALDTTFDGDGKVTTAIGTGIGSDVAESVHALAIDSNGKLVGAGDAGGVFGLARYNANGSLDTTFDGDGKTTTSVSPVGNTSVAYALTIQGDGKPMAAGRAANSNGFTFHHDFALARYNANGSLDKGFDGDGKVTTEIAPTPQVDLARALVIQPDGRAVAAGYADMGPPEFLDYDFAIVRHLPNGDDVPPAVPTLGGTDPASPGNDNSPRVKGSTDAGSTVKLYDNPSCSGPPAGQGPAADFTSAGVEAAVPSNTTTTFYATATDRSGNPSACSASSVSYVEDSIAPNPPTLTGTDPASPADNTAPRIYGSAEPGSVVKIYRACNPFATPIAQGSAAELAAPGIQVSAAAGASNGYSATATDAAGNVSACSASITYVEVNPQAQPGPPPGGSTPPPFPGLPGSVTGPAAAGDDDGDPPRIVAPRGFAGSAGVDRRGFFTVPRTRVACAPDGGVCDVIASASSVGEVPVKVVRARRAKLTLGSTAFTVEAGERSRVKIRLSRKARSVLRRVRRVRAVVTLTVTNLRETSAARTVKFTVTAPRRRAGS